MGSALATTGLGRTDEVLVVLDGALEIAEPEGFCRTFVDEGEPLTRLMGIVRAKSPHRSYIDRLLAAFDLPPQRRTSISVGETLEPLSERALEVLRLIAVGASNREIAETLLVSIGTVKKHVNNIFIKLDAHSRTQAVATAQKYNILE